jgi:NADH-quinone oxidoreductase subunit C
MNDTVRDIAERAQAAFPGGVSEVREALGEITVLVEPASITEIALAMKDEHGFDLLADLCGVDRGPEEDPRFEVNYHLFSTTHYGRIRLKVRVPEDDASVPTVTGIWATANWHERETFDLFGIRFDGHPDLRRILLPSDFDGHALRKDYPLRGYEPYSMN